MMLKVLTATLVLTSILFTTDARPTPPKTPLPDESSTLIDISAVPHLHAGVTVFTPLVPTHEESKLEQHIIKATVRFRLPDIQPNPQNIGHQVMFSLGISGYPESGPVPGGVDKDTHTVHAGVAMDVTKEGVKFNALVGFLPDQMMWWAPDFPFEVGHEVELQIEIVESGSEAMILIIDHTVNRQMKTHVKNRTVTPEQPFRGVRVEWMVAPILWRHHDGTDETWHTRPLANFGEVDFYACSAYTNKGRELDLSKSFLRHVSESEVAHTEVVIGDGQGISEFKVLHKGKAKSS
ncbi:hypothetical protein C8R42DRAFT_674322 [Lentinula raphanica]|nr:hypothetical protein C8R42DRAFT_674322 [Lentinula raphanica]